MKKLIKNRLQNNINPASSYANPIKRVFDAVVLNKKDYSLDRDKYADAAWAKYLGNQQNEIVESKYKPTKSTNSNSKYYTYPELILSKTVDPILGEKYLEQNNTDFLNAVRSLNIGESAIGVYPPVLNQFTYSRGFDDNGEYVSVYDKYDINPFKNHSGDVSFGIGTPFEFYDRLYLDDYYNIPKQYRGTTYLPEIIVTPKQHGGKLNYLNYFK